MGGVHAKPCLPRPGEEKVIRDFLPRVKRIATPFVRRGMVYDDLEQAGRIGVLRAIRTYDPSRGASFHTWASRCIRWAMQDAVAEQGNYRIRFISLDQRQKWDTSVGDGGGEKLCLHEIISSPDGTTQRKYAILHVLVEKLPKQERAVIRAHYWGRLKFSEIARAKTVTRQRVSAIHQNAIQRLRKWYGVEVGIDGRT